MKNYLILLLLAIFLTACLDRQTPEPISFSSCTNDECREAYFGYMVNEKGTKATFDDLKQRYENESYVRAYCHQYVHMIGRAAAEKYPSVQEAFSHGDAFCWSGYYHGVMETMLSNEPTESLPKKIDTICDNIEGKETYSFDYYNCVHGLGHGVMFINANELFDAIEMCDKMSGDWEEQSCASGVFMENVMVDNKFHFSKYLDPERLHYPCTDVPIKYRQNCYLMQTSYMLKIKDYNFSAIFDLCEQSDFDQVCYQSLGRDASGNSISDVNKTKEICLLGKTKEAQANCIIGAVKDFISYHHSDVKAKELCASLSQDLQQTCFDTAEEYYKNF